jgi:hypothetical protein
MAEGERSAGSRTLPFSSLDEPIIAVSRIEPIGKRKFTLTYGKCMNKPLLHSSAFCRMLEQPLADAKNSE